MHGRIRLGRIAGVYVSADWTVAVMFVVVALALAAGEFPTRQPQWTPLVAGLTACGAAVLFVASVLARELAQAVVARRRDRDVCSLTLFAFGGIPYTGLEPAPAATELRMAMAGPMVSLLLGMICFEVASAEASPGSTILVSVGWMNVALCAINVLPAYPLDGGRALRAIVWAVTRDHHWATWISCRRGQAFGWAAILCGIALCFGVSVPVAGPRGFRSAQRAPGLRGARHECNRSRSGR